jgi:UDP-N-acetylglucosamine--N-acetylmuramyl-(pentapeptide) pyrophosphoryl-undecaprenol N-acetylglucosamine transferase
LETRLVPEAGFELRLIDVGPLKSVSFATRLRTLSRLPASIGECKRIIREFRPGAVLGVGGYASGPAMAAALRLKIPTMAYEPNAMPGLANRLVGRRVQRAAINFPAAAAWFRNAEVTGVPVRPEFFSLPAPPSAQIAPPHLLIFGGSLGARIFNTQLPKLMPALLRAVPGLTVLHQCGERHAAATLARAHLILSRSGATTVAEEAAAGKPALLVPFAAATDDHQRRNAEAMVDAGAAIMLEEKDLEIPERMLVAVAGLLNDPARLAAMSAAARTQAHPGAAERIADRLAELAGRKRG